MKTATRTCKIALLLAVLCLTADLAVAADGTIEIRESTFNDLAAKLEPIRFQSPQNGPAHPVKVLGVGCDGNWTANVTGILFTITESQVKINGSIRGDWTCGLAVPFTGTFQTTAQPGYDASARQINVSVNSATVTINFGPFSRTIDVAGGLSLPPIPFGTTAFFFETVEGPTLLRLQPYNVTLRQRNGFLELQGDARLW